MADDPLKLTHMDTGVVFYHENDERALFEWLERIECVDRFQGEGSLGLVVYIKHKPGRADLRQFMALGQRYGIGMRQFARYLSAANRHWFADPEMFWHEAVFGPSE